MNFKLGKINGWSFLLDISFKKDRDFYNEFNITIALSDCYEISNGVKVDKKYFIFEIFKRRLIQLTMENSYEYTN